MSRLVNMARLAMGSVGGKSPANASQQAHGGKGKVGGKTTGAKNRPGLGIGVSNVSRVETFGESIPLLGL